MSHQYRKGEGFKVLTVWASDISEEELSRSISEAIEKWINEHKYPKVEILHMSHSMNVSPSAKEGEKVFCSILIHYALVVDNEIESFPI
jgi:hypothetical protein